MNQEQCEKLAVVDIDGTLIKGQMQKEFVGFLFTRGQLSLYRFLRINIWFIFYRLHLTNDVKGIFEFGVGDMEGKSDDEVGRLASLCLQERITPRIFKKSPDLISGLHGTGYKVLLLSTAIEPLVSRVAAMLGADEYVCTRLEKKGDLYTGKIDGEVVYGPKKISMLMDYISDKGYSLGESVAYADHESDIPLLKSVGNGYVVNPSRRMMKIALRERLGIMYMK